MGDHGAVGMSEPLYTQEELAALQIRTDVQGRVEALYVGDRMYWSTELLRQAIATDAHLVLTRWVRVEQNPDGTKMVVMERVKP